MINRALLDEELKQEFGLRWSGIIYKGENKRRRNLIVEIGEGFCSNDPWFYNNDFRMVFVENFRRVEVQSYNENTSTYNIFFSMLV